MLLALMTPSCFSGTDPDLTESGEGKPVLSIKFPPVVEPDSSEVASLTIENPGPGDIPAIKVAFAALGASDLPDALVGFGANKVNPSVLRVDPEPTAISPDAAVFTFPGVAEGDSATIDFTIRTPVRPGRYANSVIVSDGTDPARERGVPLETRVEG